MTALPITYTVLIDESPPAESLLRSIKSIEVERDVRQAAMLRLSLNVGVDDRGTGWRTIDDNTFESRTKISVLISAKPPRPRPLINAYVVDIKPSMSAVPGGSTLEVVAMDAQVLMRSEEKVAPRPNQADSTVATKIFRDANLVPVVDRTTSQRDQEDTVTTQSSTDGALLDAMAERNGFEFYVQPDVPGLPDEGHFHAPRLDLASQGTLNVNMGVDTNATNFSVHDDRRGPSAVSARAVDHRTLDPIDVSLTKTKARTLGAASFDVDPETTTLLATRGIANPAELSALVQAEIDRSNWAITATGETTVTRYGDTIRIGEPINVRGAGGQNSGAYYVTAVTYMLSPGEISQRFTLQRNAREPDGTEGFDVEGLSGLGLASLGSVT
jgi:hypothetical protein